MQVTSNPVNQQPPESLAGGDGSTLEVNRIWLTIQGEGPFAGEPAVFIRLAGCNIRCNFCDTEYTQRQTMTIGQIATEVMQAWLGSRGEGGYRDTYKPFIVLTGGEPFRQNIVPLLDDLAHNHNAIVQIETNGTLPPQSDHQDTLLRLIDNERVFIIVSPKAAFVHSFIEESAEAFKYVASVDSLKDSPDGLPLRVLGRKSPVARPSGKFIWPAIFLQPEDTGNQELNEANMKAVVASCLKYGYRLSLQLHKIAGVD